MYARSNSLRSFTPRYRYPRSPGLGAINAKQLGTSAASMALATAAMFDPEPISKTILAIGAGLVSIFSQVFSGCGQTCIQATRVVDQVEAQVMKPNLAAWQSAPAHLRSLQQKHLALFDEAWSMVLQGCGDPALGDAGRRCISERQRGGTAPWCPNSNHTGCDWFALYRDPIANATDVVDDSNPISDASTAIDTFLAGGSLDWKALAVPALAVGLVVWALE